MKPLPCNIAIVCNPVASHARAVTVAQKVISVLKQKQVAHSFFLTNWPHNFESFTHVWIVGGDGTLNYFINRYPGITLPLSIFPGGSGNDFRWMLYQNQTIEEQVHFVLHASTRLVDAGQCNGRLFLNGVGIGFDGAIVKDLMGKKMRAGKASYLYSILKNILRYKETSCVLQLNEQTITQPFFMISVANGRRYGGGFLVAPKALVDDGLLDVNAVGKIAPWKRIRYLPVIEKGRHLGLPFVRYQQTGSILLRSSAILPAHMDGDYFSAKEFVIQALPNRFTFSG